MTREEAIKTLLDAEFSTHRDADYAISVFDAVEMATNALEKAEKYRWHNLRKDPADLPTHMHQVQICWVGGSHEWYDSMFFDHERNVFSVNGKTEYEVIHPIIGSKDYQNFGKAIAWREIELFEE